MKLGGLVLKHMMSLDSATELVETLQLEPSSIGLASLTLMQRSKKSSRLEGDIANYETLKLFLADNKQVFFFI